MPEPHELIVPERHKADFQKFLESVSFRHEDATNTFSLPHAVEVLFRIHDIRGGRNNESGNDPEAIEARRGNFHVFSSDGIDSNFETGTAMENPTHQEALAQMRQGNVIVFPTDPKNPRSLSALSCVKVGDREYLLHCTVDNAAKNLAAQQKFYEEHGIAADPKELTLFERICDAFAKAFLGRRGVAAAAKEAEKEALAGFRDHVAKNQVMREYINAWKDRQFEPTVEEKRGALVEAVVAQEQREMEQRQKEVEKLQKDREELVTDLNQARQYLGQFGSKAQEYETQLKTLNDKAADLKGKIAGAEKAIADADREMENVKKEEEDFVQQSKTHVKSLQDKRDADFKAIDEELNKLNTKKLLEEDAMYDDLNHQLGIFKMDTKEFLQYEVNNRLEMRKEANKKQDELEAAERKTLNTNSTNAQDELTRLQKQKKVKGLSDDVVAALDQAIADQKVKVEKLKKEEKELTARHKTDKALRDKDYKDLFNNEAKNLKNPDQKVLDDTHKMLHKQFYATKDRISVIEDRRIRMDELNRDRKNISNTYNEDLMNYNAQRDEAWSDLKPKLDGRRTAAEEGKKQAEKDLENFRGQLNITSQKAADTKVSRDKCIVHRDLANTAVNQKQEALNTVDQQIAQLQPNQPVQQIQQQPQPQPNGGH